MRLKSFLLSTAAVAPLIALPLATNAQVIHKPLVHAPASHVVKPKVVVKKPVAKKPLIAKKAAPAPKHVTTSPKNRGVSGTVASISGTSLTVTSGSTTYTVDASQAKLLGFNSGLSLSNVQVGDNVRIMGTINGTSVTATGLMDQSSEGRNTLSGSVTAINSSTLTLTARNKTTYTVDASSAIVTKGIGTGTVSSMSAIQVGDRVMVMGSVSGSSATATSIRDMGQFKSGMRGMRQHGAPKS
jgi:hypothetical protein